MNRKRHTKMDITIRLIVFLSVALAVFVVTTVIMSMKCAERRDSAEIYKNEAEQCKSDVIDLIIEKRSLLRKNEEQQRDNEVLTDSYKEISAINRELTNPEPIDEQPPLYYEPETDRNPILPPEGIPTNTFRCEPFRVIDQYNDFDDVVIFKSAFIESSEQYKLQQDCVTDNTTGIRVYFDDTGKWYYCAALATAYGITIGNTYEFTLANGTVLPVICADFKHDISNPRADDYGDADKNYDGENCINIIEFVVDMQLIPVEVRKAGTMSALEQFGGLHDHGGNIIDVKETGRKWNP